MNGQPVENPADYEFRIHAKACEPGDIGIVPLQAVRAQEEIPKGCFDAKPVRLPISQSMKVTVTPEQVEPSNLDNDDTYNEVDVRLELLKMPPGRANLLVNLEAEVLETSDESRRLSYRGGHNHVADRPAETFQEPSYRFGKPGVFRTKLRVSQVGGLIRVTASSPEVPNLRVSSALLRVEVPGLVRLPRIPSESTFSGYYLVGGGGEDNQDGGGAAHIHPSNHWGTHDLIAAIDEVSTDYMYARIQEKRAVDPNFNQIGSNVKVLVNDMSLERGGLFDVKGNWAPSHFEHRHGTEVDMITEKDPNDSVLVTLWARVTSRYPLVHDGSDGLPLHIHGSVAKDF